MKDKWLTRRRLTLLIGALVFLGSCAAYYSLSSAAGCAADLKGGTWGDPARALELESMALVPGLAALTLVVTAPFVYLRNAIAVRALLAVVVFSVVAAALFFAGIEAEFNASHECSAQWRR